MVLISVLYGEKEGTKEIIGRLKNSVKKILAEYKTDGGTMLITSTSRKKWDNKFNTRNNLIELIHGKAVVYVFDTHLGAPIMDTGAMAKQPNGSTEVKPEIKRKSMRVATLIGKMSVIKEINQIGVFEDTISVMKYGYAMTKTAVLMDDVHVSIFDTFDKNSVLIEVSELADGESPKLIYHNHTVNGIISPLI